MVTKFVPVVLRAANSYDPDVVSRETSVVFDPEELPSLTQQQFADEADINTIVKRFGLTGELPENFRAPVSGDFTGVTDFQSAMNAVVAAQNEFMSLPGELRARFRDDPQELMNFVSNDKNKAEAIELGLIPRPVERTRDVVQAVDELAAKMTIPK